MSVSNKLSSDQEDNLSDILSDMAEDYGISYAEMEVLYDAAGGDMDFLTTFLEDHYG